MAPREIIVLVLCVAVLGGSFWWFFLRKPNYGDMEKRDKRTLRKRVQFYRNLSRKERRRFEKSVLAFLHEVQITGVKTPVTRIDELLVAASAAIPLFGFPDWHYPTVNEVLLYEGKFDPDYRVEEKGANILGMVGSGAMNRMMILSKPDLHRNFKQSRGRFNVGIHEFIHLLDKKDGATDGVPEQLMDEATIQPWLKLMHREIKAIERGQSDLDKYGATHEAEFLSVAGEYFFQRPQLFQEKHPDLYDCMTEIFHQDPAKRLAKKQANAA